MKVPQIALQAGLGLLAISTMYGLAEKNNAPHIKVEGNCASGTLITQPVRMENSQYEWNSIILDPPNTLFALEQAKEFSTLTDLKIYPKVESYSNTKTGSKETTVDLDIATVRETTKYSPSSYLVGGLSTEMTEGEWYQSLEFEGSKQVFKDSSTVGALYGIQDHKEQIKTERTSNPISICRDGGNYYSRK